MFRDEYKWYAYPFKWLLILTSNKCVCTLIVCVCPRMITVDILKLNYIEASLDSLFPWRPTGNQGILPISQEGGLAERRDNCQRNTGRQQKDLLAHYVRLIVTDWRANIDCLSEDGCEGGRCVLLSPGSNYSLITNKDKWFYGEAEQLRGRAGFRDRETGNWVE